MGSLTEVHKFCFLFSSFASEFLNESLRVMAPGPDAQAAPRILLTSVDFGGLDWLVRGC